MLKSSELTKWLTGGSDPSPNTLINGKNLSFLGDFIVVVVMVIIIILSLYISKLKLGEVQ